jgi:DNA-binding PadR family transcriptional regulator
MGQDRTLTELEGTVLGVIFRRQPCTPYQVRREFTDSPSTFWSGSAGSIYPLVMRLEASGLVRSNRHATGSRKSRLYRLTAAGKKALALWISAVSPDVLSVPPDPLRTRIAYLEALPPEDRLLYLESVLAGMEEFLRRFEEDYVERRAGDRYAELMAKGAMATHKSRIRWTRDVMAALREETAAPQSSAT